MEMENTLEPNVGGISINMCKAATKFLNSNPQKSIINKMFLVGSIGSGPVG